jgi:hypothetical protein
MLDQPVAISSTSLATVTQSLPITPVNDAVHAILYDTNPFQRGIVHKQGACPTKEGFTTADAYAFGSTFLESEKQSEEGCDAWSVWAQPSSPGYDFTNVIFGLATAVAMAIGAYLALTAVLRLYDVETATLSEQIGKLMGVYAKSLKEKVGKIQSAVNSVKALRNPTAALGDKLTSTLDDKAQALLRA